MTHEKKPEDFNLDDIQLKSDALHSMGAGEKAPETEAPADTSQPKTRRRDLAQPTVVTKRGVFFPLLSLLFAAGCGAVGYLYWELNNQYQALDAAHQMLIDQKEMLLNQQKEVSSDLDQTAGTLKEAQAQVINLRVEQKKKETRINQLESEVKSLKGQVAGASNKADQAAKAEAAAKKSLSEMTAARDRAREESQDFQQKWRDLTADFDNFKQESSQKIQQMEADHLAQQSRLNAQLESAEAKAASAKQQALAAAKKFSDLEARFEAESTESLKIIQEKGRLESELRQARNAVAQMQEQVESAQAKIRRLETVETGELVPFSDQIRPAVVSYREPLGDAKFPRRLEYVAVQVLIDEAGAAQKAFVLPGQDLDGTLSAAIVKSVLQWKFEPAMLEGVRVKTWQTVLYTP